MLTFKQATDEMKALFLAAWNAETAAIVTYVPEIRWQGVEKKALPDGSKYWVRFSKQTVTEEQSTLSNCEGLPGQKVYTASGLIFIQLFCPKSEENAQDLGGKLAAVARNAFRGKTTPGKVWFRNVRINELSPEDLYVRFNVVAEFEYDELG